MINKGDRVLIGDNGYDDADPSYQFKGRTGTVGAVWGNVYVHVDGLPDPEFLGENGWAMMFNEVTVVEVANADL